MQDPSDAHYQMVVNSITNSRLIPFLGAGANLCDRPDDNTTFKQGEYLPSGIELADYLATNFGCPSSGDLARVSQYIDSMGGGTGALYQALRVLSEQNTPRTRWKHGLKQSKRNRDSLRSLIRGSSASLAANQPVIIPRPENVSTISDLVTEFHRYTLLI